MENLMARYCGVPMTVTTLASLYPDVIEGEQKVRRMERSGELVRLKRGLYVPSAEAVGAPLSLEVAANHIYAPSYVSMSSALRHYGLIPEAVYAVQSMTVKRARNFDTPLGRFEYRAISRDAFSVGLRNEPMGKLSCVMASPEKALCDLVASSPGVLLHSRAEAEAYLFDDLRMDEDGFSQMRPEIFQAYALVGKKPQTIENILKLLQP